MPSNTVVVSRPSKWGNPFRMDKEHSRADCVGAVTRWIRKSPRGKALAEEARTELRGKNLACWCPLGGPCHADVLLQVANQPL
jgi:hypothetical protein